MGVLEGDRKSLICFRAAGAGEFHEQPAPRTWNIRFDRRDGAWILLGTGSDPLVVPMRNNPLSIESVLAPRDLELAGSSRLLPNVSANGEGEFSTKNRVAKKRGGSAGAYSADSIG